MQQLRRASGILLHPTSLPGRFGIGDLGSAACRFIDFLAGSGQQLWQIMPLGPTSYGDSPYQTLSAFAGNPSLISLERLVEDQYLAPWDFLGAPDFPAQTVDYGPVIDYKQRLLRLSFENFKSQQGGQHVVAAMPRRAVPVLPPGVARQQPLERGQQVGVGARARLDHGQPGGGVRDPQVQQTVLGGGLLGQERRHLTPQVVHDLPPSGVDRHHLGPHGPQPAIRRPTGVPLPPSSVTRPKP